MFNNSGNRNDTLTPFTFMFYTLTMVEIDIDTLVEIDIDTRINTIIYNLR